MVILEDTRQQENKHNFKLKYFEEQNIKVDRCGLYVGDYTIANNQKVCVDTKKDLQEIIQDVTVDHDRFRKEMLRAKEAEITLYILCEEGITDIEEVKDWQNPRLKIMKPLLDKNGEKVKDENGKLIKVPKYPRAMTGEQLYKIIKTQEERYGIKYLFCKKEEAGKLILELLGIQEAA